MTSHSLVFFVTNLFNGRISRTVAQYYTLGSVVIVIAMIAFFASFPDISFWASIALISPFAILALSITIRRMHDINLSGWWFIPIIAGLAIISLLIELLIVDYAQILNKFIDYLYIGWLLLTPGTNGSNKFGEPDEGRSVIKSILNIKI